MVGRIFCVALVGLWLAGCGGGSNNNGGDTDGGSDAIATDLGDGGGDTGPDAIADADADATAAADAAGDADAAFDGDAVSDADAVPDADGGSEVDADADVDADTGADADADADGVGDADTGADTDTDGGCQDASECDDGDLCTTDTCSSGACVNTPVPIDDGDLCTTDACDPATGAVTHTAVDIDDAVSCTVDACEPTTGVVTHAPADVLCQDGLFCNGVETCAPADPTADPSTGCVAGEALDPDDSIDCTLDECVEGDDLTDDEGELSHTPVDAICQDGLFCNGSEICDPTDLSADLSTGCVATTLELSDGLDCTIDECDEGTDTADDLGEITHTPSDAACQDGLFCNGAETCDPTAAGADATTGCLAADPVDTDDGFACTVDSCDEGVDSTDDIGEIVNAAVDASCQDGLFCNGAEACDPSDAGADPTTGCVAGVSPVIDDGSLCTADGCDEGADTTDDLGDITHVPDHLSCQDGLFCNGSELCDPLAAGADPASGCAAGDPPDPSDGIDCTDDTCDEGVDLTDDAGTSVNAPNDAFCDNALFCDGAETCDPSGGASDPLTGCVAGVAFDPDDGIDCTVDACDEDAGAATHTPNDAPCQDGLFCNGAEVCDPLASGADPATGCVAGAPVETDDAADCTIDGCDEGDDLTDDLGTVTHDPQHEDCQDGLFCNGAEICDPAAAANTTGCAAGVAPDPDDGVACTDDSCDEGLDPADNVGAIVNAPNAVTCQDGLFCNGAETCDPADAGADAATGCVAGAPPADDGYGCTIDECDEGTDVSDNLGVVSNSADDSACLDGLYCNGVEFCDPADGDADPVTGCVPGAPPVPDDGFTCTVESCDEGADLTDNVGTSSLEYDDAGCLDGLFCNGSESCDPGDPGADPATGCAPGTAPEVDDGVGCTEDLCLEGLDTTDNLGVPSHIAVDSECPDLMVCAASLGCVAPSLLATDLVITELRVSQGADNAQDAIEIFNPTAERVNIGTLMLWTSDLTELPLYSVNDYLGEQGTEILIEPGGYIYGVPNPAEAATIPASATFVWGAAGEPERLRGAGADFTDFTVALVRYVPGDPPDIEFVDVVETSAPFTDAGGEPPLNALPFAVRATTQLDADTLDADANDELTKWCLSDQVADSLGSPNHLCAQFTVNEVLYDFSHPIFGGADEGRVFVELAGPGGGLLQGLRVRGMGSTGATQPPNVTLGARRMPLDGFFVIADGDGDGGTTSVANADLVVGDGDPQNGPNDAIWLLLPDGTAMDRVGYGTAAGSVSEGNPAPDADPLGLSISIARDEHSTDTDDNATDFHLDPTPSPGEANAPVVPVVLSLTPDNGLAGKVTPVRLVSFDLARLAGVDGDSDNIAVTSEFGGVSGSTCTPQDAADLGRGAVTWTCVALANDGASSFGEALFTNPVALGAGVASTSWVYTGVLNETGVAGEIDFCELLPPTTINASSGQLTEAMTAVVREAGVTDGPAPSPTLIAEFGYGPDGVDPSTQSGWIFSPADYVSNVGSDANYKASFTAPQVTTKTTYYVGYRFSIDGGLNFTYCDRDGSGSDPDLSFNPDLVGRLVVSPTPP